MIITNKNLILSLVAIATFGLAAGVFAKTSDLGNTTMQQMHQAMLNGDYNIWRATANQYGMGQIMNGITQENFSQMDRMHDLMFQGNYDEANAIHQNLNTKSFGGMMRGF